MGQAELLKSGMKKLRDTADRKSQAWKISPEEADAIVTSFDRISALVEESSIYGVVPADSLRAVLPEINRAEEEE